MQAPRAGDRSQFGEGTEWSWQRDLRRASELDLGVRGGVGPEEPLASLDDVDMSGEVLECAKGRMAVEHMKKLRRGGEGRVRAMT